MVSPITAELRLSNADFMSKWNQSMSAVSKGATEGQSRLSLLGTAAQDAFGKIGAGSGIAGQGVNLLAKSGGELGASMGSALPIIGAAAAGLAAVGLVVKSGVSSFVEYATQVRQVEIATGSSARQAEQLVTISNVLGVSTDSLQRSVGLLSKSVEETPQKFSRFGVQIARNADGTTDLTGTLINLGDAFKGATDAAERNDMARSLLGRGYQELQPILAATDDTLRQILADAAETGNLNFSASQIDSAYKFKIATNELGDAFDSLKRKAGAAVTPLLAKEAEGWGRIIGLISGGSGAAAENLSALEKSAKAAAAAEQQTSQASTQLQTSLTGLASARASSSQAQQKLSDLEKQGAVDAVAVAQAEKGLASAHHSVGDAQRSESDAQRSLNDLLAQGKVDATQVAEAEKELERATRSTDDARKSLIDAEQKLADVRRGASPLDRQQSDLRVAEAADTEAAARKNLSDLMQSGAADGLQMAQAEHAVKQAQLDAAKAGEDRNAVLQQGTDGAPDTVAAQGAVEQATRAVADATDAQNTAADKLRTAQAGDPAFDDNVARARQGVADAAYRVQQASDAERDAGDKLKTARAGDPDYLSKLQAAHDAVAQAAFGVATAYDAEQKAAETAGPAMASLRGELEKTEAEFPLSSPYVSALLSMLPTGATNQPPGWNVMSPQAQADYLARTSLPAASQPPGWNVMSPAAQASFARSQSTVGAGHTKLASGGIVKARPGGIWANIGEGGFDEAVVPLTGGAGTAGGMTVNVNVAGSVIGGTPAQIAAALEPHIRAAQQQAASRTSNYGLGRGN